jgi:undecaprenyl-diphosphatase
VLLGIGALWVVVTCADRLFMGAHFLSDVTAGVLLGCGLCAASYAGYLGWSPPTPTKGSD